LDLPAAEQRVDWAQWMTLQLRDADWVLAIASPEYKRRSEGDALPGDGRGVQWEGRLIRELFYANQDEGLRRMLPVVLPGCSADDIPLWLAPVSATYYLVSDYTVGGAEKLLRVLTGQPWETEPPLGTLPTLPPRIQNHSAPGRHEDDSAVSRLGRERPSVPAGTAAPAAGQPATLSWRQQVDTARSPSFSGGSPLHKAREFKPVGPMALLWASSAIALAFLGRPAVWLSTAVVAGLAAYVAGWVPDIRVRRLGVLAALLSLTIYALTVIVGNYGIVNNLCVIIVAAIFAGSVYKYPGVWLDDESTVSYDRRFMRWIQQRRWLSDTDLHDARAALLDQLGGIPSVRFAHLPGKDFPFLAVAGNRIVLIRFAHWPPGRYTWNLDGKYQVYLDGQGFAEASGNVSDIFVDASHWRSRLKSAECMVAVVVAPDPALGDGHILLQMTGENGIDFVTPETFGDTVGTFLAAQPYELDFYLLKNLVRNNDGPLGNSRISAERFGAKK
jgi:hypothetical protein